MRPRHRLGCVLCSVMALGAAVCAEAAPERQTGQAAGQAEYFAIFMEGKKVGYGIHARAVAGEKVTTTDTAQITISRAGVALTVRQSESHVETLDGKPLSFTSLMDASLMTMKIEGTVTEQGKVQMKISVGPNTQERTTDWPEGALLNEGVRLLTRKKGLSEGTTFTVKMYVAGLLGAVEGKVQVGPTKDVDLLGRIVKLTEVKTLMQLPTGQITTTSYVDKDFNALKVVSPVAGINVEMVACSKRAAMSKPEVFEAFGRTSLKSPTPLKDPRSAKSITYQLAPIGGKKISLPTTGSQTVRPGADGTLTVTVLPVKAPKGASFPYKGSDKHALEALKPTRYLQCDDEKVVALARKAVGDTKDAGEAVKRIERFVHEYVNEKGLDIGYASAAEVAESRQGDCSEHAVLLAAMCRAVGIPAQVVMGVAYVKEFGDLQHVFGGHAWTRALVGGKWIDLDGTFNGFDAGHIAQAVGNGNPESFFEMLFSLGRFRIAKISVAK